MASSTDSSPAPTRRERRRAETRSRLLEAARELFARQGVEATAIAEITEEADVGFGSFYNHFSSKDEIVETVLTEAVERQGQIVDALTADLTDPAEVMAVAHRHFVRQAATDPSLGWLLVRLDSSHRVMARTLGARARRDLERGLAAGRFNVPDPAVAFADAGGALILVMRGVLDGDIRPDADCYHAQAVLQMLGVPAAEAAEVSCRPLPALSPGT
jgi:AcrR family transcriptional regulator